jgi:hypothetical protein
MGFFDFLFGSKRRTGVEILPDQIWMTTEAKFAGLTREAEKRSRSESVAILLVAHFPDVLERLDEIASGQTWDVPCKAVPASRLNKERGSSLGLDESAIIDIIVGERHPLPSVDDRLTEFAGELPCRGRVSHHVSLEDAAIKVFTGEGVKNVLKQLGMTEDEAIKSRIVSRRIRQAQQKIEGRAFGSLHARSAAEWLEKNCPDLD